MNKKFVNKKALITGITGQDGSYLAELLLSKGYEVHGIIRRSSTINTSRIDHLFKQTNFYTYYGDLTDTSNLNRLIEKIEPEEIFKVSFDIPEYTTEVDALGTLRFLDALKSTGIKSKFYQASTSELFGKIKISPQSETTPFYPRSPYGVAKLFSYWTIVNYREAYNLYCCNGILFNHESPRRGETFVTRKISMAVCKIILGQQEYLEIGNLDAKRDWGYAPEYVEGMWLMLQQKNPEDYVLATGETHTVREFIEIAFKEFNIDIVWNGNGVEEKGVNKANNKILVKVDAKYFRPTEVDLLLGDASKAKSILGWEAKTKFSDLVKIMIKEDYNLLQK